LRSGDFTYQELAEKIWLKACDVVEKMRRQL
jgi:hypothetical protein